MTNGNSNASGAAAVDLLIVARDMEALSPLMAGLSKLDAADQGLVQLAALGHGAVEAAAATARALSEARPAQVLCIGTADAYPNGALAQGAMAMAQDVYWVDGGVLSGHAAAGAGMGRVPRWDGQVAQGLSASGRLATPVTVASSLAVAASGAVRPSGAVGAAEVHHSELYGVAVACEQAAVPWAALLVVTGEVGRAEDPGLPARERFAAEQLANAVLSWLTA